MVEEVLCACLGHGHTKKIVGLSCRNSDKTTYLKRYEEINSASYHKVEVGPDLILEEK